MRACFFLGATPYDQEQRQQARARAHQHHRDSNIQLGRDSNTRSRINSKPFLPLP